MDDQGFKSTAAAILSIAWLFAGYIALPIVVKSTLGFLGTLAGAVSDRSRGLSDRLNKFRREQPGKRANAFRQGELYNGSRRGPLGALARRTNAVGRRADLGIRGNFGIGEKGRQAEAIRGSTEIAQTLKENPRLAELANNDNANAVLALSGGTKAGARAAARELFAGNENLQAQTVAAADLFLAKDGKKNATAALQTMAQNKSRAIGGGRVDLVAAGIERIAGGNEAQQQSLAYMYQYNSRGAGRADLGGNWMGDTQIAEANAAATVAASRAAAAPGATPERIRIASQQAFNQTRTDRTMMDGVERTEVSNLVRGHGGQITQLLGNDKVDENGNRLEVGTLERMLTSDNKEHRQEAAVRVLELQKALPYANGGSQKAINDFMARNSAIVKQDDIENSLVNHVNSLPPTATTPNTTVARLSGRARVYDQQVGRNQDDRDPASIVSRP